MSHEKNQAKALLEIWTVLVRFRWRFIVPSFAVMAIVLGAGMVLPRKYKAESIFEQNNDMVLDELIDSRNGATAKFQNPKQAIVNEVAGQAAIASLKPTLDPILSESGLGLLDDGAAFYRNLNHRIVVRKMSSSRGHDRIRIEYIGTNPTRARLVVNTLVENYITRTRATMNARLKQSAEFFKQKANVHRGTIEELENKRLQFEIEHDLLLPDAATGIQTMLSEQQLAMSELLGLRESAEERVRMLADELERTPPIIPQVVRGPNPHKERMRKQLSEAERNHAHYLNTLKMTERHPDLINIRQQIAALTEKIKEMDDEIVTHTEEGQNPKRAELEMKLAESRADASAYATQVKTMQKQLDKMQVQSAQIYPVQAEYRAITREVDLAYSSLNLVEKLLGKVDMAMAAQESQRGVQFNFIKPCGALIRPVSPNLHQVLAAALLLGTLAGALSVFFAYRTDESFTDGDQLTRAFDLPLVGSVSEIISTHKRRLRRLRGMIFYPAQAAGMAIVLVFMAGLLYLNLERPALFKEFTANPSGFLQRQLSPQVKPADTQPIADQPEIRPASPRTVDRPNQEPKLSGTTPPSQDANTIAMRQE